MRKSRFRTTAVLSALTVLAFALGAGASRGNAQCAKTCADNETQCLNQARQAYGQCQRVCGAGPAAQVCNRNCTAREDHDYKECSGQAASCKKKCAGSSALNLGSNSESCSASNSGFSSGSGSTGAILRLTGRKLLVN